MAMRYRTPEAVDAARQCYTKRTFTLGLDLGQAQDPTALAVLERVRVPKIEMLKPISDPPEYERPTYRLVHLERLPLGTSYPSVIDYVQVMMTTAPLRGNCKLVVDETGVGKPVVDMFRRAKLSPTGITITAGDSYSIDMGRYRVSKLLLVSTLDSAANDRRLILSHGLKELAAFTQEMQNFLPRRTATGYTQYGARSGMHDDLVLAVAIALWYSSHQDGQSIGVGDLLWR